MTRFHYHFLAWPCYDYLNATDAQKTTWDEAGRMKTFQSVYDGFQARYRADGMRVTKVSGLYLGIYWADEQVSGYYDACAIDRPTTRYYYDGQMPIEEDFSRKVSGADTVDLTRHGLGARGVDFVRVQRKSGTGSWTDHASGWPVYDTHGNNVGMLTLSGSTYSIGDERTYDAWGAVKTSAGSPPEQGYCANLGHRADGESSLVYMRARYYEPGTGRFVSEDPAMDGVNWYAYCSNDPVNRYDYLGLEDSVSATYRHALLQGLSGNWQEIVDLLDTISVAMGAPIDGRARLVLDLLEAIPTPKGGLKKVSRWFNDARIMGKANQVVAHIIKVFTCRENDLKHHLDDIANWVEEIYRHARNR